ncbi:MAG TPA: SMC-Scp complex subunit ScpB [Cellvibrionaceae bacterium]
MNIPEEPLATSEPAISSVPFDGAVQNTFNARNLVEAAIFAAIEPVPTGQLLRLLLNNPDAENELEAILTQLQQDYENRGVELVQVASGWRFQVPKTIAFALEPLYQEKPKRFSRVILETLAIIAYRQPITRAEIEALRGVAVSVEVLKTLIDRNWVRSLGPKEVPGRPLQYGTTDEFLDYFNVQSLAELPGINGRNPNANYFDDLGSISTEEPQYPLTDNTPRPDENQPES